MIFPAAIELNGLDSWRHYTSGHRHNALCPLEWALVVGVYRRSRSLHKLEGKAELLQQANVPARRVHSAGTRLCKDDHNPRLELVLQEVGGTRAS
jgi:hypothetical protein